MRRWVFFLFINRRLLTYHKNKKGLSQNEAPNFCHPARDAEPGTLRKAETWIPAQGRDDAAFSLYFIYCCHPARDAGSRTCTGKLRPESRLDICLLSVLRQLLSAGKMFRPYFLSQPFIPATNADGLPHLNRRLCSAGCPSRRSAYRPS